VKGPDSGDVKRVLELFGGEFAHPLPRAAAGVVDEDIDGAKRRTHCLKAGRDCRSVGDDCCA